MVNVFSKEGILGKGRDKREWFPAKLNIDGSAEISVNDDTVNNDGIVTSPSLVSEIEASKMIVMIRMMTYPRRFL